MKLKKNKKKNNNNNIWEDITILQTRFKNKKLGIFIIIITIIGTVIAISFSIIELKYDLWIVFIIGLCAFVLILTLLVATWACLWQTISWMSIKIFERGLWTFFCYLQRNEYRKYADLLTFNNENLEAIIYIAVMPIIISFIMFLMFSQIARMNVPFIKIEVTKHMHSHNHTLHT